MTVEQQRSLELELADVQKIDDPARRAEATTMVHSHILIALVDCQRKTSDRVKELYSDRERKQWLRKCVSGFAAAGGFTLLMFVLKKLGVML